MEKLTYFYPKEGKKLMLLAGIFMVGLSGFLIYIGVFVGLQDYILGAATPIASLFLGSIGMLYFGYLLLHIIYRLFSNKPILEVSEAGIVDNSSLLSPNKCIPYEAIRKVTIKLSLGTRVIDIVVHDESLILTNESFIKRLILLIRKRMLNRNIVTIEVHGQNRKEYEKIVKCINQHRRNNNLIL